MPEPLVFKVWTPAAKKWRRDQLVGLVIVSVVFALIALSIGATRTWFPWVIWLTWISWILVAVYVLMALGHILAAPFNRNARIELTDVAIQQFEYGNQPKADVLYDSVKRLSCFESDGEMRSFSIWMKPHGLIRIDDNIDRHDLLIQALEERTGKTFESRPLRLPRRPNLGKERGI